MKLYHLEWYDSDRLGICSSILYKTLNRALDAAFLLAQTEYHIKDRSPDGHYEKSYSLDYRMHITVSMIDLDGPEDSYELF